MASIKDQMEKNGYVIIDNFLTAEEIRESKRMGEQFVQDALAENMRFRFNDKERGHYFLDSADRVSYFYEADAFNDDGTFKNNPDTLKKVGHALHKLVPIFRRITFSERVANVCRKLGMTHPSVVQSMYMYKNPRIGEEVPPHADASFQVTEPQSLYGFWSALDDATVENGCLWFYPGSHARGTPESSVFRFIRNPDGDSDHTCMFRGTRPVYDEANFVAVPLAKGSCVIFHGNVVHRSLHNHSEKPRNAYAFHIYDRTSKYSQENWLQAEFENIY